MLINYCYGPALLAYCICLVFYLRDPSKQGISGLIPDSELTAMD